MAGRDDIGHRLREVRADHDARRAEIDAGEAPAAIYTALDIAYTAAGDDLSGEATDYAKTLVCDDFGRAQREGCSADPQAIGERVGERVRRSLEGTRRGAFASLLGPVRPSPQVFERVQRHLDGADEALPGVTEPSPLAEWRKASEERSEQQTAALRDIYEILKADQEGAAWARRATVVSAAAAVIAAAVSIATLVIGL
jgi:hypothetical protein